MTSETFCCAMRGYFTLAMIPRKRDTTPPTDVVDFILDWGPPIVLRIKHCPFCGKVVDSGETTSITHVPKF